MSFAYQQQDYFVNDWIFCHNLKLSEVIGALHKGDKSQSAAPLRPQIDVVPSLTAQMTLRLVVCSLSEHFPVLSSDVAWLGKVCTMDFSASPQDSPYTRLGNNDLPLISMCFRGSAADILCVAHEFGHALQLYLSKGRFIPPIYRELAAFIAEAIFLKYVEENMPHLNKACQAAWQDDSKIYLHDDAMLLFEALKTPASSLYKYRYNYPIARLVAENISKTLNTDKVLSVFRGNIIAIQNLVAQNLFYGENSMRNYLPELPEMEKDLPAINAYRSLGMMVLLDIDYWQGESEKSIEEYYSTRLAHMQTQTALVAIGAEKKPIGYATWDVDPNNTNIVHLKRQAAPFGDHLELQKKLQECLPKDTSVLSHHSRSAREEQVAW